MREFLRRSSLWARELGADSWPFFDVAALIDPAVRAPEQAVTEVVAAIPEQQPVIARTCQWALHFAALADAGVALPDLPHPYAPLLHMYELGGGFLLDGTGFIEIDSGSIPMRRPDFWIDQPAKTALPEEL
ncbi:hypothetical protein GXW82_35700 [Streptacidiphilus sp. 4-A2]|nr:hypothetical protein [Streptacidiphilus sp. 4-A2]